MPLMSCHIGWMSYYQGVAEDDPEPRTGGSSEEKGEVCNLRPYGGKLYGYASAWPHGIIDISRRFGADPRDRHVDGVNVVWTATHPSGGKVIVDSYKDAIVFRQHAECRDRCPYPEYNITVEEENGVLLREEAVPLVLKLPDTAS